MLAHGTTSLNKHAVAKMEQHPKRHCWECLRRRLVCDFKRPACKRCSTSGIDCPGYSDTRPGRSKWLMPGKAKSRIRRPVNKCKEKVTEATTEPSVSFEDVVITPFESRTEAYMLIQASKYYNTSIYPNLLPISELGPKITLYQISPAIFQFCLRFPDYIRLSIICMTLSHRINKARQDNPETKALTNTFFRYRGLMIRSLSEDIKVEHKSTSNLVIAGILTLILLDAQHGCRLYWRCHLEGIQKIIMLRGGIRSMTQSHGAQSLLLCYAYYATIGDTTSPASNLVMAPSLLEELEIISKCFGDGVFIIYTYPTPLFVGIVRINHLCLRASKYEPLLTKALTDEANKILGRIQTFPSEQWAESGPSARNDWILIGNIFQAAVALYCISSPQSSSILPLISILRGRRNIHGHFLQVLLKKALSSPSTRDLMLWPLVVLGMEAVNGGAAMRTFVREQLSGLSRFIGMYVPLKAKEVLERFWASSKITWDACFDRLYAFATQTAVDVCQLG